MGMGAGGARTAEGYRRMYCCDFAVGFPKQLDFSCLYRPGRNIAASMPQYP